MPLEEVLGNICSGFSAPVFGGLASFLTTGIEPEVTTSAAQSIAPMATSHNAAFYATESGSNPSDPDMSFSATLGTVSHRVAGSLLAPPSTFGLYGADAGDAVGMGAFASLTATYTAGFNTYNAISPTWVDWLTQPLTSVAIVTVREAYRDGIMYLPTIDPLYMTLIGARQAAIVQSDDCECTNYSYGESTGSYVVSSSGGECSDLNVYGYDWSTECNPVYNNSVIYKDSDGLILAESASQPVGNVNYPVGEMLKSNHFAMRNNPETRMAMEAILSTIEYKWFNAK